MGKIASSEKETITLQEAVAMDMVAKAGLTLYDNTGNTAYLPSSSAGNEVSAWMHIARMLQAYEDALVSLRSQTALGTFKTYQWLYADVSLTPTILPFSTKSVTPLPTQEDQIIVFKNGVQMPSIVGWKWSQTGLVLTEALIAGDEIDVIILSSALATTHKEYTYTGASGTGVGQRTFTIDDLGEDIYGNTITRPSASDKIWVFWNGQYRVNTIGYTYSAGVVTMLVDIATDDYITFMIWSA